MTQQVEAHRLVAAMRAYHQHDALEPEAYLAGHFSCPSGDAEHMTVEQAHMHLIERTIAAYLAA